MKIEEAAKLAGSKVALACLLGVTEKTIWKWSKDGDDLPSCRYYQMAGLYAMKRWRPVYGQKFPKE